jgi:hypothetical protein
MRGNQAEMFAVFMRMPFPGKERVTYCSGYKIGVHPSSGAPTLIADGAVVALLLDDVMYYTRSLPLGRTRFAGVWGAWVQASTARCKKRVSSLAADVPISKLQVEPGV